MLPFTTSIIFNTTMINIAQIIKYIKSKYTYKRRKSNKDFYLIPFSITFYGKVKPSRTRDWHVRFLAPGLYLTR